MSVLDDGTWEYWVRINHWSAIEAMFILDGIIPSGYTLNRYGYYSEGPQLSEPDFEIILGLIKRKFGREKIDPKVCLEWAEEMGFSLEPELIMVARRLKKLKPPLESRNELESELGSGKGKQFGEMRTKILSAALRTLNRPPEGFKLWHKADNRINITQLRNALVDHGHELVWKNGNRVSPDTIYDTLQSAIKPDPPEN